MNAQKIKLKKASNVSVRTIIENYTQSLLPSNGRVERAKLAKDGVRKPPLLAEHGLSLLIDVCDGPEQHYVLMDFGGSKIGVPHNLEILEIDVNEIEAFVISHGHHDHIGAIFGILNSLENKPRPVVVHPDAFLQTRFHKFPDGRRVPIPGLKESVIEETGNEMILAESPTLLAGDYVLATGQIPMTNDFEKGVPTAFYEKDGKEYKDHISDDMAVILDVKDKGLVVITGCGHAGVINTVRYAKEITGAEKIYGVIGGFHLIGNMGEAIIERTIEEMKKFDPEIIVPSHCTGLKAIQKFEKTFPDAFVLNASGTKVSL
jgi:7,8-dihydropterin-6-yl-methyl-4-(beta-D-ribofuranosyl)aminobenzene 5'-phosphate synthase